MTRILVISNSFGQDSVRYLHGISRAAKDEIRVANLYIGGCSLHRHYQNMLSGDDAYRYELNGTDTKINISLQKGAAFGGMGLHCHSSAVRKAANMKAISPTSPSLPLLSANTVRGQSSACK